MSGESDPTSSNELLNDIVTNDINPVEQNTPRFYHRGVNAQINTAYDLIKSIPLQYISTNAKIKI